MNDNPRERTERSRGKKTFYLQLKDFLFNNLANTVTVLGLLGAIWLIVIALNNPEQLWLILLLAGLVGLTDLVDGWLAKSLKIQSDFGAALDRLRDKIFICPTLIVLAWYYSDTLISLPIITSTLTKALVILVILIEILLFTAWFIAIIKKLDIASNKSGRRKMFFEFMAVMFWLISLAIGRYLGFPVIQFSIYLIDLILVVTIYLAVKSLESYCVRYTNLKPETKTENPKPKNTN